MKHPRSISALLSEVEKIVDSWPVEVPVGDVVRWMLQFDVEDFDLALRVIRNLNVVGDADLRSALSVAYSKLMRKAVEKNARITNRNTLFAGIGDAGKSGSMIAYHFRMTNPISEENFLHDESMEYIERGLVENLVLIDDFIATGRQATDEINELAKRVTPLGVKNIFVLAVCGMREGIEEVQNETKAYTFSAFEYDTKDTVASLDSAFYSGLEHKDRSAMLERLRHYGRFCQEKNPLGYGAIGGLVAFYYNTPNSTVPVVWSDNNDWIPLFRRVRRINGISAYYSQFDRALKQKASEGRNTKDQSERRSNAEREPPRETTLFVEGKTDEIFFDILTNEHRLAERAGLERIDVVALGVGVTIPERLLDVLTKSYPSSVFIFDGDFDSSRSPGGSLQKQLERVRHIILQPSIMEFLDTDRILASERWAERLARRAGVGHLRGHSGNGPLTPSEIERILFRMYPPSVREKVIRELTRDFLLEKRVDDFAARLRRILLGS